MNKITEKTKSCLDFVKLEKINEHLNEGFNSNAEKFSSLGVIYGAGVSTCAILPYNEVFLEEFANYELMIFTYEKNKYYYLSQLIPDFIKSFNHLYIEEEDLSEEDKEDPEIETQNYLSSILDNDENDLHLYYSKKFLKIILKQSDIDYLMELNCNLDKYCSSYMGLKCDMEKDEIIEIIKSIKLKSGNIYLQNSIIESIEALFNCLDIEIIENFDLHEKQFLYNQYNDSLILVDPMFF